MQKSLLALQIDKDLQLCLLEERHAEEYFALTLRNKDYLRRWGYPIGDRSSVETTRDFIERRLAQFANNRGFHAGIWYQGRIVGAIGYNNIEWEKQMADIYYWVDAGLQGKGLVSRTCRTLVDYAFDSYCLNKVEIHCAVENVRSRAIPERLGFVQEAIIRHAELLPDGYVDHVIYGMRAREWKG